MHTLATEPRTQSGTRTALQERGAGRLPISVVGQGKTTEHFTIATHEFDAVLRHRDKVVDLMLPSGSQRALIQSVQWDHLGDDVMHIDFLRVVIGQKIDVEVPVELVIPKMDLKNCKAFPGCASQPAESSAPSLPQR